MSSLSSPAARTTRLRHRLARAAAALATAAVATTLLVATTSDPAAARTTPAQPAPAASSTAGATPRADFDPATFDPTALDREPVFARWGVEGRAPNIADGTHGWKGPQPYIWDIAELGDVMYVAGIFTGVRHNPTMWPNDPVRDQPFLAAFDRATGEFIPTFAPRFDGPVYEVVALPDGTLLAGGEFARVNGEARAGLVALDPDRGRTLTTFGTTLAAPGSTLPAFVKELLVEGNQVYVAGSFSRVLDGSDNFVWNVVRLDAATGKLDRSWIPRAAGAVWDLDIDRSRGRVHLGGYFTSVDALPNTLRVASVELRTGRAIAGLVQYAANSTGNADVVGISFAGDATWVFGGNHLAGVLDPVTNARLATFVPSGVGDLQVAETYGRYTISGHHRDGNGGLAIFDNVARTLDLRWIPNLLHGWYGIWALDLDREGCLWIGGDMSGTTTGKWLSGLVRFCPPRPVPPNPGGSSNLAQGRSATQSSTAGGAAASRAVDGNTDGVSANGSVALTKSQAQPWWQVDLGQARDIGRIEVFARTDTTTRTAGVWVLGSANPITATGLDAARNTPGVSAVPIGTLAGPSTVALNRSVRYLRVQAEGTTALGLAEVRALTASTDAVAPPTALRATVGADNVILRWDAPTTEAVAGYLVHRDGLFKAWVPNLTFFQDLTARTGETYRYEVRSRSIDGRFSAPVALTAGSPDTEMPTVPNSVAATPGTAGVALRWAPSSDNRAVRGYLVHRDYQFLGFVTGAEAFTDTSAVPGVRYRYEVRAQDAAGNTSGPSTALTVLAGTPDTEAPTAPTTVTATAGAGAVSLSWSPATDNRAVTGYLIHRDHQFLAWVPSGTSYRDTTARSGTRYRYEVRAQDAAGNTGNPSSPVMVLAGDADGRAPTAPTAVTAVASTGERGATVDLTWSPATDDVGVAGYLVHRDYQFVAWVPVSTSFTDSGLVAGTTYRYEVRAQDAAGNTGAPGEPAIVTVARP